MIGHYKKDQLYFMDLEYYEKAVISLKDFTGIIGMIGGEPVLHPQFEEMCEILCKHIPDYHRRGLWSGVKVEGSKYEKLINETFGFKIINDPDKKLTFRHTSILASSKTLVPNDEERQKYINACWINQNWSATINPKGGYYCEVAGAMALLMDGPNGRDINNPAWWDKDIETFKDQIDWACQKCGACLPLIPRKPIEDIDDITEDNLEILKDSPRIKKGKYEIYTKGLDNTQFRDNCWYSKF
jgi:hypothetical protein